MPRVDTGKAGNGVIYHLIQRDLTVWPKVVHNISVLLFIALHTPPHPSQASFAWPFLWVKSNIREDQFVVKIFAQKCQVSPLCRGLVTLGMTLVTRDCHDDAVM